VFVIVLFRGGYLTLFAKAKNRTEGHSKSGDDEAHGRLDHYNTTLPNNYRRTYADNTNQTGRFRWESFDVIANVRTKVARDINDATELVQSVLVW